MSRSRPAPKSWRCKCGREISLQTRRCPGCGGRPVSAGGSHVHDAHAASLYGSGLS